MTLIWDVTRVAFSRVQAIPPSLCCSSNLRLTAEVGEGSRYADVFFPNVTGSSLNLSLTTFMVLRPVVHVKSDRK